MKMGITRKHHGSQTTFMKDQKGSEVAKRKNGKTKQEKNSTTWHNIFRELRLVL
jgi:hypothetical protein